MKSETWSLEPVRFAMEHAIYFCIITFSCLNRHSFRKLGTHHRQTDSRKLLNPVPLLSDLSTFQKIDIENLPRYKAFVVGNE